MSGYSWIKKQKPFQLELRKIQNQPLSKNINMDKDNYLCKVSINNME